MLSLSRNSGRVSGNRTGVLIRHRILAFFPLSRQGHVALVKGDRIVHLISLTTLVFPAIELIAVRRIKSSIILDIRRCSVRVILVGIFIATAFAGLIRHLIGFNVHLWGRSFSNGVLDVGVCDRRVALVGFILAGLTPVRVAGVGLHLDLNDQSFFGIADALIVRREIIIRDPHGLAVGGSRRFGCVLALLLIAIRIDRVDLHIVLSTGKGEVVGQRVGDHGVLVQLIIDRRGNRGGDFLEDICQIGSVSCRLIVVRRIPIKILGDLPTMIADTQKGCRVDFQPNVCSALKIA